MYALVSEPVQTHRRCTCCEVKRPVREFWKGHSRCISCCEAAYRHVCQWCTKVFHNHHKHRTFCSPQCSGKAQKGKTGWSKGLSKDPECLECGEKDPAKFYKHKSRCAGCLNKDLRQKTAASRVLTCPCGEQDPGAYPARRGDTCLKCARERDEACLMFFPPGTDIRKVQRKRIALKAYNLTVEDFIRILGEQGGHCALCDTPGAWDLHVDHDHRCCPGHGSCGKCVRGILCVECNLKVDWAEGKTDKIPGYLKSRIEAR